MWRNDIKCNYLFLFPLKNSARKGLNIIREISPKWMLQDLIDDEVNTRSGNGLVRHQVSVSWLPSGGC